MKRIFILDRFYFPDEQATSIYLTELTRALQGEFDFEILCGPPLVISEEGLLRSARNDVIARRSIGRRSNLSIYQVPCFQLPKRFLLARALNDLSFLFMAMMCSLFVRKPDLVVTQTSPPGVWWVGCLLSRWHRARWVHVFQDVFPDNLQALSRNKTGFIFSFLDKISSFPTRRADQIIAVGEDMKNILIQKGFSALKIRQIHNWVDLNFIRPLPKKNSFSERHQVVDKFVVLYAGNLGRVHNFEDLLEAAEKLRDYPEIVFLIVGEGALKKQIIRQIKSRELTNIHLIPFEPRSHLAIVLATADLNVVLLRKGMAGLSVPSKVYSILASGRPILACLEEESDVAKMVRVAQAGFVVPPGHSEELAQVILKVFQSNARNQYGANARRYAERKDFQKQAFRDYTQTFHEVLEER